MHTDAYEKAGGNAHVGRRPRQTYDNYAHCFASLTLSDGMERVVCIPAAKVRIVKVWDPELQLSCDMNVNNVAALENTRMINLYVQIDDRVRPLAMIIKHWTKRRILNDAGESAISCMQSFSDMTQALVAQSARTPGYA
jgi:DNA polymerase sigma